MQQFETQNALKHANEYECTTCDFKCCKKSDMNRHLSTVKHKMKQNETQLAQKNANICSVCYLTCNSRTTLWRHKKKCKPEEYPEETNQIISTIPPPDEATLKEMFIKVLEQNQAILLENQEMRKLLQETIPKIGNTTNNTTNNTNNNNFNLNFFLNEQCKDALNIMDFINQLQLNTSDLDMVGRVGYAEGISKIFIRGLKELDIFKRPLHCSDLKREVVYVKDKDSWEKDGEDKKTMKNAIKFIAAKNFNMINDWIEDNPEYNDYDSKKHKEYHNIILKASGGATPEEDEKNYNKIIRNVAQEITIDKSSDR